MAAKNPAFSSALLRLIYNAVPIPNLADNASASPATSLYVALHTADPTGAADQTAHEVNYAGYARVATGRNAGGWTVTGASASPSAAITFPEGTGGGGVAYWASVGPGASGATPIYHAGPLAPPIALGAGIAPQLTTAARIAEQ